MMTRILRSIFAAAVAVCLAAAPTVAGAATAKKEEDQEGIDPAAAEDEGLRRQMGR